MNWIPLVNEHQLTEINRISFDTPQIIFKHSTRCSISSVAKNRLERAESPSNINFYYLDLIAFRELSNKIAETYQVHHESPQVLLIKNGECIFDESHNAINMDEIVEQAG
jgi:bacillithiol system protein YtxJ